MYSQIIGCVIMGFSVRHKKRFFDLTKSKMQRVLYMAITSGLCGSITSFSSWALECNKVIFVESRHSYFPSHNDGGGGRFCEWLEYMLAGAATPLLALRFGFYLSKFSKWNDQNLDLELLNSPLMSAGSLSPLTMSLLDKPVEPAHNSLPVMSSDSIVDKFDKRVEALVSTIFVVLAVLVIVVPLMLAKYNDNSAAPMFTFTAVFGSVGAYIRYSLSKYNTKPFTDFPVGTFAVNVIGSWLIAIFTLLQISASAENHTMAVNVLGGLTYGFCGCLTTISTFAVELDRLPSQSSYIYGILSNLVAQFGIVIIYMLAYYINTQDSHTAIG